MVIIMLIIGVKD